MASVDPAALAKLPKSYLDQNNGQDEVRIAIVFLVLQTLAGTMFFFSRYVTKTLNGWDVWLFMPVAFLCVTGLCVCAILSTDLGGAGHHIAALLLEDPSGRKLRIWGKIDKVVEFTDVAAIMTSKLAILCLYWRIFGNDRRYRIAIYVIATIMALNWIAGIAFSCSICQPLAYQWDKRIQGGHCGNIVQGYQMMYIPNLLTDFMMLLLPLPSLYKLHVDIATKIGLIAVFMTGSVGIITCILRMIIFFQAQALFKDPTYIGVHTFVYTVLEAGTYFIAACLPALRPLKRHFWPNVSLAKSLSSLIGRKTSHDFRSGKDSSRSARNGRSGKSFRFAAEDVTTQDVQLERMVSRPLASQSQVSSKSRPESMGFRKLEDEDV